MAIVRFAPFTALGEDTDGFDRLVRRTFGDWGSSLLATRQWPALDAYVDEQALHVRLEVPGIDPDNDVEIEVDSGVLHIRGERRETARKEGENWFRNEIQHGSFERRIALPDGVDVDAVTASYDAGVLDITVPLPAQPKTKVKVSVGTSKQLNS